MRNREDNVIQFKKKRKGMAAIFVVLFLVVFIVVLLTCFRIDSIEVTGNKHYNKEEIKDFVFAKGYIDNTVLLMLKNKIHPIEDIPFIAKLDIEYVSAHKVTVTVYEKAMAGCI